MPYVDDDFIYVDPKTRAIVGPVQWNEDGSPKSVERVSVEEESDDDDAKGKHKRHKQKRNYPWGSYKTMRKIYRLEGKEKEEERTRSLDEILQKALNEPFWD